MPFITRNMVRFMKGGQQTDTAGSRRIRELPYAIDPDCKNKLDGYDNDKNGKANKGRGKKDSASHASIHDHTSPKNSNQSTSNINVVVNNHNNNHKAKSKSSNHHSITAKRRIHSSIINRREKSHRRRLKSKDSKSRTRSITKTIPLRKNESKNDISRSSSASDASLNDDIRRGESSVSKAMKQESPIRASSHSVGVLNVTGKPHTVPQAFSSHKAHDKDDDESMEAIYNYTLSVLKSNIKELCETQPCDSVQSKRYKLYVWSKSSTNYAIKPNSCAEVYNAKMKDNPGTIICKVYDGQQYDSENSRFLKVLQFLKSKHPNIVSTFDIFSDKHEIYVFQKLESHGNMKTYIKGTTVFKESAAQMCASHMLRAINYLGVMGISHRSIQPLHVLVSVTEGELIYKISGFHEAVDYWNSVEQEIFYKRCISLDEMKHFDFKAPEMFGLKSELFDPVIADIWSFGATIFYSLTEQYPYNHKNCIHMKADIEENVKKLKVSNRCKEFFLGLLNIKAAKRIHFNEMYNMRWLEFMG